ncbi:hypothetical protein ACFSTC_24775 [Nonomuraea ferruginea]
MLARCALAVVAPGESQVPDDMVAQDVHWNYPHPLQRFLARRLNEVIELFESGGSVPVLLATPTEPTGHVDPVTLLERMESPGGAEPLEADFHQALLRLPRRLDPALAERADRLGSAPGRALAHWLRRGGLPDPDVTCQVRTRANQYGSASVEVDGRIAAPREIPPPIAELWTPFEGARYLSYPHTMAAWPAIMPSHREVVAAHLARFLPQGFSRRDGVQAIVAALAHADGPAGDAVAAVVTFGLGHRQPERRGHAVDALVTLTIRGELPSAAVGRTVVQLLGADAVKLGALTEALQQATTARRVHGGVGRSRRGPARAAARAGRAAPRRSGGPAGGRRRDRGVRADGRPPATVGPGAGTARDRTAGRGGRPPGRQQDDRGSPPPPGTRQRLTAGRSCGRSQGGQPQPRGGDHARPGRCWCCPRCRRGRAVVHSRPARQPVDDERGDGHDAQDERPAQLGQAASSPKRQPLPARV